MWQLVYEVEIKRFSSGEEERNKKINKKHQQIKNRFLNDTKDIFECARKIEYQKIARKLLVDRGFQVSEKLTEELTEYV